MKSNSQLNRQLSDKTGTSTQTKAASLGFSRLSKELSFWETKDGHFANV